ncbi:MAG: hypothetical protein HOJ16_07895 [Candidatus Peribacter sp.]|jgi:hypothetical protein|nr:hypothetical protein [Candidatus Peribacter sp.]
MNVVRLNDSDEEMSAWAEPQLKQIAKYIEDAYSKILGQFFNRFRRTEVEIEQCNDQGICCLWLEGRSISVEPERLMVKSIGRHIERYGWTVTTYHTINNYPHSPDDVEDVRYGESFSTLGISQIAMNAVWELFSEAYFTSVSEQEYCAEDGQLDEEYCAGRDNLG